MKKIPTLFKREFEGQTVHIKNEVTPGFEWVLEGKGLATIKWDGACCAIFNGQLYRRYDAKKGKTPPAGAIPCQPDPDPITGHWPHWVKCDEDNPSDKWFIAALESSKYQVIKEASKHILVAAVRAGSGQTEPPPASFEAVGRHFNGNPYDLDHDILIPHGRHKIKGLKRSFEGIRDYLHKTNIEGIVFWRDDRPQCKIKRTDFGFAWPTHIQDPWLWTIRASV